MELWSLIFKKESALVTLRAKKHCFPLILIHGLKHCCNFVFFLLCSLFLNFCSDSLCISLLNSINTVGGPSCLPKKRHLGGLTSLILFQSSNKNTPFASQKPNLKSAACFSFYLLTKKKMKSRVFNLPIIFQRTYHRMKIAGYMMNTSVISGSLTITVLSQYCL